MSDRAAQVRARALSYGFHRVGIAAAGPLVDDHARYLDFVAKGYHGAMSWLAADADVRRDITGDGVLTNARSVIVCALSYHRGDEASPMPGATIARYARGRDYHNFARRKLRKLASWLRAEFGAAARPIVDTAPVLERAWARRAGVGFVGKNGCIIAPGLGSYLVLGEVVTDLELPPDTPMEERCGQCTRCLDACPTQAFPAPFVLDPRRCISYWTIEQPDAFPMELRAPTGDRLFGCDHCQDVCPFNRTQPPPRESTRDFAPDDRWRAVRPETLLTLDAQSFDALTQGTPLSRPGPDGLARNAAVVLGNTGTRVHLPVLRAAAAEHPSLAVRESAAWAVDEITRREAPDR